MTVVQPETFVLTDAEAAAIQSAHMARQASVARSNPILLHGSIAAPFVIIGVIAAVDLVWYGGAMPMSLFVTLMAVFVAGMMTQTAAYWLTLQVSKRRLREQTRQVFEPRTVRLTDEGIEHALPDVRTLHAWSGIDRAERTGDLILVWAGHLLAASVPARAFSSEQNAATFLETCGQRAAGGEG
ncbi:MAG: YcxB family protein [Xanthobacteraceae bacterium]